MTDKVAAMRELRTSSSERSDIANARKMDPSVYVVLISGEFTSSINAKKETAQRVAIAGIYETREEADRALRLLGHRTTLCDAGWGVCAAWIDTAVIGQPAVA